MRRAAGSSQGEALEERFGGLASVPGGFVDKEVDSHPVNLLYKVDLILGSIFRPRFRRSLSAPATVLVKFGLSSRHPAGLGKAEWATYWTAFPGPEFSEKQCASVTF